MMEDIISSILYIHIVVGTMALITGAMALGSKKGGKIHLQAGKLYFAFMTFVFCTGIIIAGYQYNRFLFLIAFLSYYSVIAGVRSLKLKNIHLDQNAKWYDWAAGVINGLANIVFVIIGFYYLLRSDINIPGALLSIGFGAGGLVLSYANLKPFVIRPINKNHWYLSHIGNMTGAYTATFTAFMSTMVTRYELMNPYVAFILPSLIRVPLLLYWQKSIEKPNYKKIES